MPPTVLRLLNLVVVTDKNSCTTTMRIANMDVVSVDGCKITIPAIKKGVACATPFTVYCVSLLDFAFVVCEVHDALAPIVPLAPWQNLLLA